MENNNQGKDEHKEQQTDSGQEQQSKPAGGEVNDQAMGIISYLGILVIIPIIIAKDSEFAMYHANQGLILLIAEIILFGIGMIPLLGWLIAGIGWIVAVIFTILGIINAAGGKKKPLPLIGGYQVLK
ncbi:MAG: hypothetical protein WD552_03015 [Candidatus Paceibacterota bacterium]